MIQNEKKSKQKNHGKSCLILMGPTLSNAKLKRWKKNTNAMDINDSIQLSLWNDWDDKTNMKITKLISIECLDIDFSIILFFIFKYIFSFSWISFFSSLTKLKMCKADNFQLEIRWLSYTTTTAKMKKRMNKIFINFRCRQEMRWTKLMILNS